MNKITTILLILLALVSNAQNCIQNTSSLQFDGISTYVSLATNNNLDVTDSITVEAWIRAGVWATLPARGSIVCNHGWYTGEQGFVLRAGGSGQLSFNIAFDSAGTSVGWKEVISGTGALQLNTWTHVAATFDGNNMKLYINGSLSQTKSLGIQGHIVPSLDYNLSIGRLADSNQVDHRYWTGNIDEVRIWHRVLNAAELAANMNTHIDALTAVELAGYYRLNENTGTTASDLGVGNNTGTVNNGTWSPIVPFAGAPAVPVINQSGPDLQSSALNGNQWYLNTIAIPGATASFYIPTQNGSYTVIVTDINGCSATSLPFVITTLSTENIDGNGLKFFQKQSSGVLMIEMDDNLIPEAELKVFDSNGRTVITIERGKLRNEIDIHTLSAGMYILYLQSGDKQFKQKLVVN